MFKLLTASVLMIIPGLVIPLVLAFSVSDKSCLYPFSVSINNQLLAIWTHQLLVAPCLVFLWCQVMFNRSQHISAVCFLSSAAVIIHTLDSSQRGPYVCPAHVWSLACGLGGELYGAGETRLLTATSPSASRESRRYEREGKGEWWWFVVINSSWDLKGDAARVVEQA